MITNRPGPYTIRLSLSTTVDQPVYQPLSGYEVSIVDDLENSELLNETKPGVYQTSINGIRGIVGRKYKIIMKSIDDKIYQSEYEELKEPISIDTIYTDLEYYDSNDFSFDIPGFRFYLNTQIAMLDSSYFLWKLNRTYEYETDFLIYYMYNGRLNSFPNSDSLHTCWHTLPIYQIFTATTAGLSEPVLKGFPLHYVPFDNREFSIRYSLMIEQFTITRNAQKYWENVKELNISGDGLYTKVPFQVLGNVICINEPDQKVLGYFFAAGVDERRIFMDRPASPIQMYYSICTLTSPDYEAYGMMFRNTDPNEWPLYITQDVSGINALPNQVCVNCILSGGTIVKPDFWDK